MRTRKPFATLPLRQAQQVGNDALDAEGLSLDVLDHGAGGMLLRQIAQRKLRQTQHAGQWVVDLVGDAGAERADGRQGARAQEEILGFAELTASSPRPAARGSRSIP